MVQYIDSLKEYVGKTISDIDDSSCNCITITFTDNTKVMLEAENGGPPTGLLCISKYAISEHQSS